MPKTPRFPPEPLPAGRRETADPAETTLYNDPFEGVCRHALALAPEERARATQYCPRCGPLAGPAGFDPEAPCLLEGLELALDASERGGRRSPGGNPR